MKPNSQQARDLIIGKGEEWRDHTHFRSALAFAWADILLILPMLVLGAIGVFSGHLWGYGIWLALGILSLLGPWRGSLFRQYPFLIITWYSP